MEESDHSNSINSSLLEDVPSVQSDALLESVIPEMLDNIHELPVLNAEGEVKGYLSRSTLADILSDQPSSGNGMVVNANSDNELAEKEIKLEKS